MLFNRPSSKEEIQKIYKHLDYDPATQTYGDNPTPVKWVKVQNKNGKGLLIKGDDLLNFSLHKYSTDNLSRAMYSYQLEEASHNILNVDYEVSGVGGTAIRQLQKYQVKPAMKKYKLTIKPF